MNYFEYVLKQVKMSKEEFFSIYNLSDTARVEEEERLYNNDLNKYGDYMHILIAYNKHLKEKEKGQCGRERK